MKLESTNIILEVQDGLYRLVDKHNKTVVIIDRKCLEELRDLVNDYLAQEIKPEPWQF